MGHIEKVSSVVYVLPPLVQDLAPPHAGIESEDRDVPQMRSRGPKKQDFFSDVQDRLFLAAFSFEPNACDGVCREETLVHRPIEQVAQALDVAIDRGLGDRFPAVTFSPVLPNGRFVDLADREGSEIWQEEFETLPVPFLCAAFIQKPCRELSEFHIRIELGGEGRLEAQFFTVLLVDLLSQAAIAGFG